jgi:hypothetical protein
MVTCQVRPPPFVDAWIPCCFETGGREPYVPPPLSRCIAEGSWWAGLLGLHNRRARGACRFISGQEMIDLEIRLQMLKIDACFSSGHSHTSRTLEYEDHQQPLNLLFHPIHHHTSTTSIFAPVPATATAPPTCGRVTRMQRSADNCQRDFGGGHGGHGGRSAGSTRGLLPPSEMGQGRLANSDHHSVKPG